MKEVLLFLQKEFCRNLRKILAKLQGSAESIRIMFLLKSKCEKMCSTERLHQVWKRLSFDNQVMFIKGNCKGDEELDLNYPFVVDVLFYSCPDNQAFYC